jgi:hypothetical protein
LFENLSQFKYLGMTVTNKICFGEKLRGEWILVMFADIQSTTFCLLICSQKS